MFDKRRQQIYGISGAHATRTTTSTATKQKQGYRKKEIFFFAFRLSSMWALLQRDTSQFDRFWYGISEALLGTSFGPMGLVAHSSVPYWLAYIFRRQVPFLPHLQPFYNHLSYYVF